MIHKFKLIVHDTYVTDVYLSHIKIRVTYIKKVSFKNYHSREYYKNKKIKIITWVHASSQSNIRVAEIANKLPNAYLICFSEQYGAILDAAKYIVNALCT